MCLQWASAVSMKHAWEDELFPVTVTSVVPEECIWCSAAFLRVCLPWSRFASCCCWQLVAPASRRSGLIRGTGALPECGQASSSALACVLPT